MRRDKLIGRIGAIFLAGGVGLASVAGEPLIRPGLGALDAKLNLPAQVTLKSLWIKDALQKVGMGAIEHGIPLINIKMRKTLEPGVYEVNGVEVGILGRSVWMGYERLDADNVMATIQWKNDW